MDYCKACTRMAINGGENISPEAWEKLGNPNTPDWCKVCKELMLKRLNSTVNSQNKKQQLRS